MLMTPKSPFVSNPYSGYWQKAKPHLNKVRDEKGAIEKLRGILGHSLKIGIPLN